MKGLRIGLGLASVFAASLAVAQSGEQRRSGYQDMGPALQKMQDDDSANPGMLFVQLGASLCQIDLHQTIQAFLDVLAFPDENLADDAALEVGNHLLAGLAAASTTNACS